MYKVIALLHRKPGVTPEEFADYWKHVHAPLVRSTLPGLRKYVLNFVEPERGTEPPAYDGMVELHFDDRAAADRAFSSPEWLGNARRASTDAFLDLDSIVSIRAEEYIVPLQ
jgi:uncharacterized protein (TIGR02118 family)